MFQRRYELTSGVQSFPISWISKASAAQRAGRAGRDGPGHCYRLYSSALYENYFDEHSAPEILRTPVEGVVLQMKSMHIDTVTNFPFPTPPDRVALKRAELMLTRLGALEQASQISTVSSARITNLGRSMALFPVTPRYAKMLANGNQHGCLPYAIAIVAGLSVGDPFLREDNEDEEKNSDEEPILAAHISSESIRAKEVRRERRKAFFEAQKSHSNLGNSSSDLFRLLSVVGAYEYAGGTVKFCQEQFVRQKVRDPVCL